MKHKKIIWIISISVLILVVIAAVLLFNKPAQQSQEPQNLGPELEYIGKTEYGCFLICDAESNTLYYFATNLDSEQLKQYFSKAIFSEFNTYSDNHVLRFKTSTGAEIYITLYVDDYIRNELIKKNNLTKTNKKFILSLNSDIYTLAVKSL